MFNEITDKTTPRRSLWAQLFFFYGFFFKSKQIVMKHQLMAKK